MSQPQRPHPSGVADGWFQLAQSPHRSVESNPPPPQVLRPPFDPSLIPFASAAPSSSGPIYSHMGQFPAISRVQAEPRYSIPSVSSPPVYGVHSLEDDSFIGQSGVTIPITEASLPAALLSSSLHSDRPALARALPDPPLFTPQAFRYPEPGQIRPNRHFPDLLDDPETKELFALQRQLQRLPALGENSPVMSGPAHDPFAHTAAAANPRLSPTLHSVLADRSLVNFGLSFSSPPPAKSGAVRPPEPTDALPISLTDASHQELIGLGLEVKRLEVEREEREKRRTAERQEDTDRDILGFHFREGVRVILQAKEAFAELLQLPRREETKRAAISYSQADEFQLLQWSYASVFEVSASSIEASERHARYTVISEEFRGRLALGKLMHSKGWAATEISRVWRGSTGRAEAKARRRENALREVEEYRNFLENKKQGLPPQHEEIRRSIIVEEIVERTALVDAFRQATAHTLELLSRKAELVALVKEAQVQMAKTHSLALQQSQHLALTQSLNQRAQVRSQQMEALRLAEENHAREMQRNRQEEVIWEMEKAKRKEAAAMKEVELHRRFEDIRQYYLARERQSEEERQEWRAAARAAENELQHMRTQGPPSRTEWLQQLAGMIVWPFLRRTQEEEEMNRQKLSDLAAQHHKTLWALHMDQMNYFRSARNETALRQEEKAERQAIEREGILTLERAAAAFGPVLRMMLDETARAKTRILARVLVRDEETERRKIKSNEEQAFWDLEYASVVQAPSTNKAQLNVDDRSLTDALEVYRQELEQQMRTAIDTEGWERLQLERSERQEWQRVKEAMPPIVLHFQTVRAETRAATPSAPVLAVQEKKVEPVQPAPPKVHIPAQDLILLQRLGRGYRSRQGTATFVRLFRERRHNAALDIQRVYRGHCGRRRAQRIHDESLAKQRTQDLSRRQNSAALKVQKLIRGHLSRRRVALVLREKLEHKRVQQAQEEERKRREAAATELQRIQRGHAVRKQPDLAAMREEQASGRFQARAIAIVNVELCTRATVEEEWNAEHRALLSQETAERKKVPDGGVSMAKLVALSRLEEAERTEILDSETATFVRLRPKLLQLAATIRSLQRELEQHNVKVAAIFEVEVYERTAISSNEESSRNKLQKLVELETAGLHRHRSLPAVRGPAARTPPPSATKGPLPRTPVDAQPLFSPGFTPSSGTYSIMRAPADSAAPLLPPLNTRAGRTLMSPPSSASVARPLQLPAISGPREMGSRPGSRPGSSGPSARRRGSELHSDRALLESKERMDRRHYERQEASEYQLIMEKFRLSGFPLQKGLLDNYDDAAAFQAVKDDYGKRLEKAARAHQAQKVAGPWETPVAGMWVAKRKDTEEDIIRALTPESLSNLSVTSVQ